MSEDLTPRIEALAARVAASLGEALRMPYPEAKAHFAKVLRAEVLSADAGLHASEHGDLRDRIAQVLRDRIRQGPIRPLPDGPGAIPGVTTHDLADAVLPVVQPELDRLREYENALTWETSCTGCARSLDGAIAERERAEQAEDLLRQVEPEFTRTRERAADAEAARDRWMKRAKEAEAAIERVRYLQELTIATSCRVQAIDQAHDTLAVLDRQGEETVTIRADDSQYRAAIERVRALAQAAKDRAATSLSRQFGGAPFPATVHVDDVLAALDPDQPKETP